MSTIAWLLILAAVYLIRAVFKGQVLDSDGNFVLPQHTSDTITALITGDTAKLKQLNAGTPGAGIVVPKFTEPTSTSLGTVNPDGTLDPNQTTPSAANGFTYLENKYTPAEALARMKSWKARIPVRRCLHYVALAYGYPSTADGTARACWDNMPARYKHPGKSTPPPGALVFWNTGGAGHIALMDADGTSVETTDYPGGGQIGDAPIAKIDRWGERLGWADPYFRGRTKDVGRK